jgi:hypothetical protein
VSQSQQAQAGQLSADGQFRWDGAQWVPVSPHEREPTPWTRPMQLAAAGLLVVEAIRTVASALVSSNHDTVLRTLQQAGTQVPQGMTEDQLVNVTIAAIIGFAVFLAVVELVGAVFAFAGWRWAFWVVFVLMCFGALEGILNLGSLRSSNGDQTQVTLAVIQEVLCIGAIAILAWMIAGLVRYGPWAMKRPGAPG